MHDIRILRDNLGAFRDAMRRRGKIDQMGPLVDRAEQLDRDRRLLIQAGDERKAARNSATQEVARRKKAGEDADDIIKRTRVLGEEISRLSSELSAAEGELGAILLQLPNITLPEVPDGGEENNVVLRTWEIPRSSNGVVPHWEIGERLGILDLERGAKIAGSGFAVLRGPLARLTRALMTFMIDVHTREHGYEEVWVPFLVNRASMTGTGQLPKFEEDMYGVSGDDLFLVPTGEVPVTNLYRDEVLDSAVLPKGIVTYTPCFRREAGAHGKDTRGLLRVHQFDKVELVRFSTPEVAASQLELMTSHAETILQRLGLPYRVKLLASGDTSFASEKTYDLEVWSPGVEKWLEVSSCSMCGEFQARRSNIRYRPAPGEKPRFVHTLNGSALAFARTTAALLEHYQQPRGTIGVPDVLQPYVGSASLG
ncbi:MAG: serine--tRNA ligase [Gemmatimonadaceae bacterium]